MLAARRFWLEMALDLWACRWLVFTPVGGSGGRLVLGLLLPLIWWLSSVAAKATMEMSLLAVLRRRNGQIDGDEVVLWCCLWSVEDERAGLVSCGQKLPLLEVGWRREGWVGREEGLCAEGNGCCLEMRGCEQGR